MSELLIFLEPGFAHRLLTSFLDGWHYTRSIRFRVAGPWHSVLYIYRRTLAVYTPWYMWRDVCMHIFLSTVSLIQIIICWTPDPPRASRRSNVQTSSIGYRLKNCALTEQRITTGWLCRGISGAMLGNLMVFNADGVLASWRTVMGMVFWNHDAPWFSMVQNDAPYDGASSDENLRTKMTVVNTIPHDETGHCRLALLVQSNIYELKGAVQGEWTVVYNSMKLEYERTINYFIERTIGQPVNRFLRPCCLVLNLGLHI